MSNLGDLANLRVLQVHNSYRIRGGEDVVVELEHDMMTDAGINVAQWIVSNDDIGGAVGSATIALRTSYSRPAREAMRERLLNVRPDIVHVHNFFPRLTPSIYDACEDQGVPVVQTLHNYRPMCAAGIFFRDGAICEDCLNETALPAIKHRCYRDSFPGSVALVSMIERHKRAGTWAEKVTRFITPSQMTKSKFVEAGFPADRIVVKPNFSRTLDLDPPDATRHGALFVGRMTVDKGVDVLVDAWKRITDHELRLAGDGDLLQTLRPSREVRILGSLSHREVFEELATARMLIVPSIWYETFGLTVIEGFRTNTPVIASDIGALRELIVDGETGLLARAGDADHLAEKIQWAFDHPEEMSMMAENARALYESKYQPSQNLGQLLDVYRQALADR